MAPKATVSIPLPEGMSETDFMKLFTTFQKSRVIGKQRDTATRAAMKRLIDGHKPEYDRLYNEEYAKVGGV